MFNQLPIRIYTVHMMNGNQECINGTNIEEHFGSDDSENEGFDSIRIWNKKQMVAWFRRSLVAYIN